MPSKRIPLPPQDVLLALFSYDPDTGILRYRSNGEEAGKTIKERHENRFYRRVAHLYVHRIIWKMVTGVEPSHMDHADRDGLNNRWTNLRPCTNGENMWNQERARTSRSGIRGVHWHERTKRWRARIEINGHRIQKDFKDKAAAGAWREAKAQELHGRFYRPSTSIPKT